MTEEIISVAYTNPGLVREKNEDSVLFSGKILTGILNEAVCEFVEVIPEIFAVADGIGGNVAGGLASRIVLEKLSEGDVPDSRTTLVTKIFDIRNYLNSLAEKDLSLKGFGTTLAGIIILNNTLICFNTGDSRVYQINHEKCTQITHDHSLVQELCDSNLLKPEQIVTHPYKHIITSSISGDLTGRQPLVFLKEAEKKDRYLICTDGVWESVDNTLLKELVGIPDLRQAASSLVLNCFNAGATDNISFIILSFE